MSKLFTETNVTDDISLESMHNKRIIIKNSIYDDPCDSLNTTVKAIDGSLQSLSMANYISTSMETLDLNSPNAMNEINRNIDLMKLVTPKFIREEKISLPSLENFQDKSTAEAAKKIALEGFVDICKAIWKAIKEFFIDFWKKLVLFMKRLVGAQLDTSEMKKYIKHELDKIRIMNMSVAIDNQTVIQTKLPSMLARLTDNKYTVNMLEVQGCMRIEQHINYLRDIKKIYIEIAKRADYTYDILKKEVTEIVELKTESVLNIKKGIASMESISVSDRFRNITEELTNYSIKQSGSLIGILGLTPCSDKEIPDDFLRTLNDIPDNIDNPVFEYFCQNDTQTLLSNYGIYLSIIKGTEKTLATEDSEPENIRSTIFKITSGVDINNNIPNEMGVVKNYRTLLDLFSKAEILENINVSESMAFLEKISESVLKNIHDLESIINGGINKMDINKLLEMIKTIKAKDQQLDGDTLKKLENAEVVLIKTNDVFKRLIILINQRVHRFSLDFSKNIVAQLSTINAETSRELYNYIYKCISEFKPA